jgi:hypothetical protein
VGLEWLGVYLVVLALVMLVELQLLQIHISVSLI